MTSDPEAVVRRLFELFNALPADPGERAQSEALRELLALFDPQVEFRQLRDQPDLRSLQGRDAFSESWGEWLNAWQSHRSEIGELHVRGDRVLVFSRDRLVGREAMQVDTRGSIIFTVEDGKIIRMQTFGEDHDAAWQAFEELPQAE
jgi:ketosteroid isomerase-like protein